MKQIWTIMRKVVHPKRTFPAYIGREANIKYGRMIKNALEIIDERARLNFEFYVAKGRVWFYVNIVRLCKGKAVRP